MNLGLLAACLGLLLLAGTFLATHPQGDVERCRQAIEAARVIPTTGR